MSALRLIAFGLAEGDPEDAGHLPEIRKESFIEQRQGWRSSQGFREQVVVNKEQIKTNRTSWEVEIFLIHSYHQALVVPFVAHRSFPTLATYRSPLLCQRKCHCALKPPFWTLRCHEVLFSVVQGYFTIMSIAIWSSWTSSGIVSAFFTR